MADSTVWWILTGTVIAIELLSGTFYLLMLSIGLMAAAVAAHLGATGTIQITVAALVGGGAVVAWYLYKKKMPSTPPAASNHDVNLDVGETVHVAAWNADGTASVKYRGAQWTGALEPGASAAPGNYRIVEVVGSRLVLRNL